MPRQRTDKICNSPGPYQHSNKGHNEWYCIKIRHDIYTGYMGIYGDVKGVQEYESRD
jgi:hypothetical protein